MALMLIRKWFDFRFAETSFKKSYTKRDLSQFIRILIGLAWQLPIFWVFNPALDFANYEGSSLLLLLGVVLCLCGLLVFFRAHADLGAGFSPTLVIKDKHQLITAGIYTRVRHPMYLGLLIYFGGQAFVAHNLVVGVGGLLGIMLLVTFRLEREEQMLIDEFGDEYKAYADRSHRLIPGVL